MDTGLGMDVYTKIFCRDREDRRVVFAASAVICNLVNECSPLRPVSSNYILNETTEN